MKIKTAIRTNFPKLSEWLGIKKPLIILNKYERDWIKLCKGHYKDKYRTNAGNWIDTIKPMFKEVYGYDPNEHYADFLQCMFNKLMDIYLKIQADRSGSNAQIKEIFYQSFYRSVRRDHELPIERAIAKLCGLIQCNVVVENNIPRYEL